jgi:CRISPR/Cas system-associated endonuclease Cas1
MAGKAVGKVKGAKQVLEGHTGIMKRLAEEHGEVSVLLKRCTVVDDPEQRRELFTQIQEQLMSHAKAEEKILYAVLRQHAETNELTEHAIEEHQEMEDMVDRLSTMGYEGDDWAELFDELEQSVRDHVEEEERDLFAKAKHVLDDQQLKEMEARYIDARAAEMRRFH